MKSAKPARKSSRPFPQLFSRKHDAYQDVSEEEIRSILADNVELEEVEKRMIHDILDLGDTTAEEIMTPRVDMIMVEDTKTVRQAIDRMRGTGYSRMPVYHEDADGVFGVVRYKDLINPLLEGKEHDLAANYAARVDFVPESKGLISLLDEMQTKRQQMVMIVDEYGGTAGLITIEDIVEEIVGEIVDETDPDRTHIAQLSDTSWCIYAACPCEEAAAHGLPVAEGDDYETVAGWLMDTFETVPQLGDEFVKDGYSFKVRKMRRRRISELLVTRLAEEEPAEEGEEAAR